MARKPVKKSAKAGRKAGTFAKGHDPRRNVTKPGSGRPPAEFKEWCKGLLDDKKNREQVEKVLSDADHSAYKEMWKAIADRAHGKPKEHVQVDLNDDFGTALREARQRAKNR